MVLSLAESFNAKVILQFELPYINAEGESVSKIVYVRDTKLVADAVQETQIEMYSIGDDNTLKVIESISNGLDTSEVENICREIYGDKFNEGIRDVTKVTTAQLKMIDKLIRDVVDLSFFANLATSEQIDNVYYQLRDEKVYKGMSVAEALFKFYQEKNNSQKKAKKAMKK